MDFLYRHDEEVAQFVAQMIPHVGERGFGQNRTAIGILDDDSSLMAGMVFHNYDPEAGVIEISSASRSPRWMQRWVLDKMFGYPFYEIGVQMVVLRVLADNDALLGQLLRLGFELIHVPRLFGREKDGMLCTLTDDVWDAHRLNPSRYALRLAA